MHVQGRPFVWKHRAKSLNEVGSRSSANYLAIMLDPLTPIRFAQSLARWLGAVWRWLGWMLKVWTKTRTQAAIQRARERGMLDG